MIEFSEAGRRFGVGGAAVDALADVTLRIEPGSCVAIVGPNGAGKSTLLGLVLGFIRPTTGTVSVGGLAPRDWVRRHGAGYLSERFALPPEWTVRRGLHALACLEGGSDTAAHRVDDVIDRFGLAGCASKRIGTLSRGLLQRVGLAQAVLAARQLIVLDEPTEGLDRDGRLLFRELVRELRDRGATLLIASHDLAELERLSGRAVVLENGTVREILEMRPSGADVYALRTAAPESAVRAVFPDAVRLGPSAAGDRWAVRVADAADLNARLAALIGSGALVLEIGPAASSLEAAAGPAADEGDGRP